LPASTSASGTPEPRSITAGAERSPRKRAGWQPRYCSNRAVISPSFPYQSGCLASSIALFNSGLTSGSTDGTK
jgi:hypothetical protein